MPPAYLYHPIIFYIITIGTSLTTIPILLFLLPQKGMQILLINLCVPFLTAFLMLHFSKNTILIRDFWKRILLFNIPFNYLMIILLLMPCIVILATLISLLFGYSFDQFSFSNNLSVIKGWNILGVILPLLLAPLIEELGWRGYGVDSLKAFFNLFTTSAIFGVLWAIWHLPLFFIKGYYHQQLLNLGFIYTFNFFISVFIAAFIINWIYYKTHRSIPAIILFHFMMNFSLTLLKTNPFTKCIVTLLLCLVLMIILIFNKNYFFSYKQIIV